KFFSFPFIKSIRSIRNNHGEKYHHRSKTVATNSTAAPSPHGTAVETSNSHGAAAAQLGPILEQVQAS
ncbi:unnamed protein product, partial [Prunus brigantina]